MILLVIYQAFFLNVFIPGHTRGAITLSDGSAREGMSCCSVEKHTEKTNDSKNAPSPKDRANCAVCYFAARMTPATTISLKLPELGLLELLQVPPPQVVESVPCLQTYLGRGPPAGDSSRLL